MNLPKFLLADNSEHPNKMFIVHTEYPRFILDVENDDTEWIDDFEENESEVEIMIKELIEEAFDFFDKEMQELDDVEENGL